MKERDEGEGAGGGREGEEAKGRAVPCQLDSSRTKDGIAGRVMHEAVTRVCKQNSEAEDGNGTSY